MRGLCGGYEWENAIPDASLDTFAAANYSGYDGLARIIHEKRE